MNDLVISKIYTKNSYLNHNKKTEINPEQHFQIIKLKGHNKRNKQFDLNNELKISSHYLGEIDKNKFGMTTTKLNIDIIKKMRRHKEILNKLSNKEIHLKSFINCFNSPENKNNDNFIKFNKINIPQYKSTPILENIKIPLPKKKENVYNSLIVNSFYYRRKLKKNFYKNTFERINNGKSLLSNRKKIVDYCDDKNKNERHKTFNTINNNRNSFKLNSSSNSNQSSFIKVILSKNTSKSPYELKNKKIQTNNIFNDSFSSDNNSKISNNSYFKSFYIKSIKNAKISRKKI